MAKNREPEKPVESQSESGEEEEEEASSEEESDSEPELTQVAKKAPSSTPATQKKVQPQVAKMASSSTPATQKKVQPQVAKKASSSTPATQKKVQPQVEKKAPSSTPATKKKVLFQLAGKPQQQAASSSQKNVRRSQQAASSSDEEDSGSESDGSDLEKASGARKPISKPHAPEPATPARKRPATEERESKDAKKKKANPEKTEAKKNAELEKKANDDSKKTLFQRIWSEDDEIAILKGMVEYANKKKSDPVADLSAFHEFIKKNLHVEVTRTQLQDKIRKMRKKYQNNESKEEEGKLRMFSKPHEQRAYELSKIVWGKENGGEKVVMGSSKAPRSAQRKARADAAENEEVKGAKIVINQGVVAELFEGGAGLNVDREKLWKKLQEEEVELYLKRLEIKAAQIRLVLDALKPSNH